MSLVTLGEQTFLFRDARSSDIPAVAALAALLGPEQERLIVGCQHAVAVIATGDLVGYTSWKNGPEGWDIEVVAVGVHPNYQGTGLYKNLNVWIVRNSHPNTTVCAFVDDPITEHVVTTQWNPHTSYVCENGSRFYGTTVNRVVI